MANLRTTVRWIRQIKSLSFRSIWSLACVRLPPRQCGYNPDDYRTKIVPFGIMNDIVGLILACMSCLLIPIEAEIIFLKHLLTILSLLLCFFNLTSLQYVVTPSPASIFSKFVALCDHIKRWAASSSIIPSRNPKTSYLSELLLVGPFSVVLPAQVAMWGV